MPCTKKFSIDTSKPVLVTGGTGYIAGVLISQLIEEGVTVHTTVRDPSKKDRIQYLQDLVGKSTKGGSIKFFKADLTDNGSFEEAMKGCYVVFHTASPFAFSVKNPMRDLVEPALHGTENVLLQANKTPSVKRVVVTASAVAIYTDSAESGPENYLDESTWNRTASLTHNPYNLSKTLAEQRAWVIAGSQTQWRLTTINPNMVTGPGLKYHASSQSFQLVRSMGCNDPNMAMGIAPFGIGIVDVRDVAAAHIAAAYLDTAEGRHVLQSKEYTMDDLGVALGKKYSADYPIVTRTAPLIMKFLLWLIAPFAGQGIDRQFISKNWGFKPYFDNTKSKEALGIEYIPMEQSVQEMYQQMIDAKAVTPKKGSKSKSD